MQDRILMRTVAEALGVHRSTVSRALRNDPRISPEVRQHVQAKAAELGYTPDPFLRGLAAYRAKQHSSSFRGILAWLTNFSTRDGWHIYDQVSYFKGASQRAAKLGYKLETFWLREPEVSFQRLRQIMITQGIRGVILPPQPNRETALGFPLQDFAAVSIGYMLVSPILHTVQSHHYKSMRLLLNQLRALGYQRPGLVLGKTVHENVSGTWAAAYLLFQHDHNMELPPPLISDRLSAETIHAWRKSHRPDVIISNIGEVLAWLQSEGIRVPQDCAFAMPARHVGHPDCAGIDENGAVIGESAIDWLAQLVESGEIGIPAHPRTMLINGTWIAGKTVRSIK